MVKSREDRQAIQKELPKTPSGIDGLDEITGGGLPLGRPTLICGAAGCGKTLFAMEFLVHGATRSNEPGVYMSFEETAEELAQNVSSLGFDLRGLIARKKIFIDYVHVDRSEIHETGAYDLDGLFVRLAYAIDTVGAKRVVLDTVEAIFSGLPDEATLRAELRRLFRWLKEKGVTAIITGERGGATLTRYGLEEYVSDCVILLDHRVDGQISTRRLRIIKYRGTTHGTNEYPFLIDHGGISILPITSLGLSHHASRERVSTGIERLDSMLEGKGYFRGSSVLVSGTSGTGKTSLAAHFADAACRRGERCIYLALEESPSQIIRNLQSVGLELEQWVEKGLLKFQAARPTTHGLEMHLAVIHKTIAEYNPAVVVMDPVTNLLTVGVESEVKAMLTRLIDFMKLRKMTALFTSLAHDATVDKTDIGISSLMDTWILLKEIETNGERNRSLYVLKSRGMAHSNQVREFRMSRNGISLIDAYLGPDGVLTGSARLAQEMKDRAKALDHDQEISRKRRDLQRKREKLNAEIAVLRAESVMQEEELQRLNKEENSRRTVLSEDQSEMARMRHADVSGIHNQGDGHASRGPKNNRKKTA